MLFQVESAYPPGTVVVPTSGSPRFNTFYHSLSELHVPQGTRFAMSASSDVCLNMNLLMEGVIGEWVFILGDDHTFAPDTLLKLLKWNLPAVVALNVQRKPPYWPVVLKGKPGPGLRNLSWDDIPQGTGLWYPPKDVYLGNAGLLIKCRVFDNLDKPYFRAGQFDKGIINEDIYLMDSLKQVGINVPVDLGTVLGHTTSMTALPRLTPDGWKVDFYYSRTERAFSITPQKDNDSSNLQSPSRNDSPSPRPVRSLHRV